ncbi:MAG: hypothetical protein JSS76_19885 [Bacteroidetes bacterium]|nr:hypothetical protein [Bacteroidota bacterium]
MLDFLKNLFPAKDPFRKWQLSIDASYKRINNEDSVQFVNADESRILYFSILHISGDGPLSGPLQEMNGPTVRQTENGWEMKGFKHAGNTVLVCLFSFTQQDDEASLRDIFDNVTLRDNR